MTGIVTARDHKTMKVRVQFPDRDNMVSNWLPVGVQKSKDDCEYWLPDLDTQVACMMDENYEFGVVVCAIYSDADMPPISNPDLYYKRFKDGTIIQYDRSAHKLTATVTGDIEVNATGAMVATISGDTTITTPTCILNGNLVVNGTAKVSGNITGGGNIQAAGKVSDAGGAKTMDGMRSIFKQHTHKDNSHGSTTDPPAQEM